MANGRRPLSGNADNPRQIERARRELARLQKGDDDALRKVLSTEDGRRAMWWVLGQCNVFAPVFDNSGSVTAMKAGKQGLGLDLIGKFDELDITTLSKMREEANARVMKVQDNAQVNDNEEQADG